MSALERFIEAHTDEARLALGLETLEAAWAEANETGLGEAWGPDILEFIVAVRDGKDLNRPL